MDIALQSSVYVSTPEFAGWLMKRGFHWRKLWKPRWVALHGAEIVYMEKEPTLENSTNMTITKAQISSATVIDREDIDGNAFGFAIHINDGHSPPWYLRAESAREKKSWLMRLGHVHAIVRWLEDFEKVKVLGVGGTGIVHELLHKHNGQRYAMKEMEIKNKAQMQMAVSEAEMLKDIMEKVSHRNILHIEKVFQVGSKFYLVFPLCTGGELYEHIINRGTFTERDAAAILRDICGGIHALHTKGILHLDIKPENILFDKDGDNGVLKITDFGLARIITSDEVVEGSAAGSSAPGNIGGGRDDMKDFSYAKMQDKLRMFAQTGELARERLRGTIGYMSPELILMGYVCKATDVFAMGVILYILLSGRPPFHSRSNREVLEKTCRGELDLESGAWESISAEAKELIQKMLKVNPLERISTAEILAHSFIKQLDEDEEDSEDASDSVPSPQAAGATGAVVGGRKVSTRRTGGINLTSRLSGYVKQLRTEKMVSQVFSMLTQGVGGRGTGGGLAQRYLFKDDKSSLLGVGADGTGEGVILDPEVRGAVAGAIGGVLEEQGGRLSIDQMVSLIKHVYEAAEGVGGPGAGNQLAPLIFCRFLDRDGDGFVGPDDLFHAQALMLQRSDEIIRLIFRLYCEAVWYPGRQLNLMHIMSKGGGMSAAAQGANPPSTPILHRGEDPLGGVVVEPPKYISARHISAVFEKCGMDPLKGPPLFAVLCDAVEKTKKGEKGGEEEKEEYVPPPPPASSNPMASPSKPSPNANLSSLFGGDDDRSNAASARPSERASEKAGAAAEGAGAGAGGGGEPLGRGVSANYSSYKMDYADFKRACELDDVLLQAIFRRPRLKLLNVLKQADEESSIEGQGSRIDCRVRALERELSKALKIDAGRGERMPSTAGSSGRYPIAQAVGRGLGAAFGLAAKVVEATFESIGDNSTKVAATSSDDRQQSRDYKGMFAEGGFKKSQVEFDSDDDA